MLPLTEVDCKSFPGDFSDLCNVMHCDNSGLSGCGIDFPKGIRYPLSCKEVIAIDEKELLDLMVAERIQMLLKQMDSPKTDRKDSVSLLIEQAELVLKHLPEPDRDTLNLYVEHLVDRMAGEEPCLYVGGFRDGIRVMKRIGEL